MSTPASAPRSRGCSPSSPRFPIVLHPVDAGVLRPRHSSSHRSARSDMRFDVNARRHGLALLLPVCAAALALGSGDAAAQATTPAASADPRVGLGAGWYDAKSA